MKARSGVQRLRRVSFWTLTAVLVAGLTACAQSAGPAPGPRGSTPARTAEAKPGSPTATRAGTTTAVPAPTSSTTPATSIGATARKTPIPSAPAASSTAITPATTAGSAMPTGPVAPATPVAAVETTHTVQFGGFTRQYVTVAPATGGRDLPLIVFLSGIDVSVDTELQRDNLRSYVEAAAVDLAYPVGVGNRWNAGPGCCTKPGGPKPDDASFVRRVASLARAGLGADADRIYLAGYSGGGKLAWTVVCEDPAPFAAVATYGAAPAAPCPATGAPLPVFLGFGLKDEFEPIAGSPGSARGDHPPAAVNVATWRTRDGCSATSHGAVVADQIVLQGWSDCSAPGLTVVYARWRDGTHAMPAPSNVGRAAAFGPAAWAFLQGHSRAG